MLVPTIKFSILVSYHKLFAILPWFRFVLYGTGILQALWFLGVFPAVIFQCTPIEKTWRFSQSGHCIDGVPFLWATSISNTVLDYTILVLPILPVSRLQMRTEQKLLVLASFSLGSMSVIPNKHIVNGAIDHSNIGQALQVQYVQSEPVHLIRTISQASPG